MIGEENDFNEPSFPSHRDDIAISSSSLSSSPENELNETRNENDQSNKNASRELVLYDPLANGGGVTEPVSQPIVPALVRHDTFNSSSRVLPSVGAFTVQCANCFKWRLIPTKEKYEEIREYILEQPFYCETALEWRPDISCDDPADITQDGSRLWAIDKPNIAQPPPGWQRLLHIRGEGSTKFADVYYVAPSGKRLRSTVDIQKYLMKHPEYLTDGVSMARFSFQIPKPLQENYVKKRRAHTDSSCEDTRPFAIEADEVNPIAWVGPDDSTASQLGSLRLPDPPSGVEPVSPPAKKKKAKKAPAKEMHTSTAVKVARPEEYGN